MGLSHYHTSFGVRSYETGRLGIISTGTLLRYLEHVATEASAAAGFPRSWYDEQDSAWVVRQMTLEVDQPIVLTDELNFDTWPSQYARIQAYREYLVTSQNSDHLLARARAHWVYVGRQRGLPIRLPAEIPEQAIPDPQTVTFSALPIITPPGDTLPTFHQSLIARSYEADIVGHINNTIYIDWLEEAIHSAFAQLPVDLIGQHAEQRHNLRAFLQRGVIDYMKPALPGDTLEIITTCTGSYPHGLAWSQVIQRKDSEEPIIHADTCWSWLP
ncbi:MAG TPA: acyl-ACP thioesterase domain-containing protein [Ktedonobacterales bacterium]|jgi:acyl-CoA thioester hydrolase